MKRLALAIFLVGVFLIITAPSEAAPPPRPEQPRPDLFSCGTYTCDVYNPVTIKAKATRMIAYRVVTEPGCTAGIIPQELERMNQAIMNVDGISFTITRNDQAFDFTVHINCGSEQIRICGSVNVFCLNRGYPYVADVDISDILSTYYAESRLSILLHEIMGHAIGSWGEQYALCGASCGFAPTPNWRDIMNTGPDSRHGIEVIELERLQRTMPELFVTCTGNPCWDGARWKFDDGRSWSPSPAPYGTWYDATGAVLWSSCDPTWNGRYSPLIGKWIHAGDGFFPDDSGQWAYAPAC